MIFRCDCDIHATDEQALSWEKGKIFDAKSREVDLLCEAVRARRISTQPVILITPPPCLRSVQAQQAVSWEKLIFFNFRGDEE